MFNCLLRHIFVKLKTILVILNQFKKSFLLAIFLSAGIIFYACKKQADQPIPIIKRATLNVEVMHHSWTIPNIPVYIKTNATEFPGKDTSVYDFKSITNQSGYVQFAGLPYGNYYLFVHGWDPVFIDSVIGYKPVIISDSSATGGIIDDRVFVSE